MYIERDLFYSTKQKDNLFVQNSQDVYQPSTNIIN